jgi:hypothetical protein
MAAKKAKADAGVKRAPNRGTSTNVAVPAATSGGTEEVVVTGRRLATAGTDKFVPMIVNPDSKHLESGDYEAVSVKALSLGIYGDKRRPAGEVFRVFVHKKAKELPSWMEYLEDTEKGQDEGSRGLFSGGREDDRIREERKERTNEKGFKKSVGKGSDKIEDPTIVEDALPLGEGGNARKPEPGGERHVI